ncbi:ABC transporter ATP-binding protein [Desulfonema magnum]|nr:ABC transporter ATP-binding protein [Desulfonema magnum]
MGHIVIKNLRKEYIDRRHKRRSKDEPNECIGDCVLVLDNINLEFCEGEMVTILGPSGCGKSTLLRIIAGFDKPTAGSVVINGETLTGPSSDHIFVFQHNALLPWMTVQENVALGLRGMEDKEMMKEQIQEHIELVELEGFENHYPYQLSGGMQRRAELARALAVNPDTLFMDEPFTGLDFLAHMKMREEVVNMHEYFEKTILVVTHDIDDALIMGDRIVVLSGRPAHVKLSEKLDFPRPRSFVKNTELSKLRDEVYLMLGVNYAV